MVWAAPERDWSGMEWEIRRPSNFFKNPLCARFQSPLARPPRSTRMLWLEDSPAGRLFTQQRSTDEGEDRTHPLLLSVVFLLWLCHRDTSMEREYRTKTQKSTTPTCQHERWQNASCLLTIAIIGVNLSCILYQNVCILSALFFEKMAIGEFPDHVIC